MLAYTYGLVRGFIFSKRFVNTLSALNAFYLP
jgi:hypothetical protein